MVSGLAQDEKEIAKVRKGKGPTAKSKINTAILHEKSEVSLRVAPSFPISD